MLAGESWTVEGASVGKGKGVSEGRGSVGTGIGVSVGSGVDVSCGGRVFVRVGRGVWLGTAVVDSRGVPTREAVLVPMEIAVTSSDFLRRFSCRSFCDHRRHEKTPASSIAAPAFSKVIFTNRALTEGNWVRIVSASETVPLKPVCSELKTCAYST